MVDLSEPQNPASPLGLYQVLRPILFKLDAEWAHTATVRAMALAGQAPPVLKLFDLSYGYKNDRLKTNIAGLEFENPVGLAAGWDKNGVAIKSLARFGFGSLEVGSISAEPALGNPPPRLFRLPSIAAVIVNYGVPNEGAASVANHLRANPVHVPLGANIVKTNASLPSTRDEIFDDFVTSIRALSPHVDYFMLNLSCPNTDDDKDFFADSQNLTELLRRIAGETNTEKSLRVFLKLSPLGGIESLEKTLAAVEAANVDFVKGFSFNLAPGGAVDVHLPPGATHNKPGAIAGRPVRDFVDALIPELYRRIDRDRYTIIASGGVFTPNDLYKKLRLGASHIQLLTALVYRGPALIKHLNKGLVKLMDRDGFKSVDELIGIDASH